MHSNKRCILACFIISGLVYIALSHTPSQAAGQADNNDFFIRNQILAGTLYLKTGNIPDALREFESAQQKAPEDMEVLIGLVRCYSRIGDFDKAHEALLKLQSKNPNNMKNHLITAEYLALKGHVEEAAEEFILLIEKGIYRFEALQGLIQLYASNGNPRLKSVFDRTVPLYEMPNQLILYRLATESLDKNGKHNETLEYINKYQGLIEQMKNPGENAGYSDVDPLEWTIKESQRLLGEGQNDKAEELLAEGSRRWPGEAKIQELLKKCYFDALKDVPFGGGQNTVVIPGEEVGKLVTSGGFNSSPLSSNIPLDAQLDEQTKAYVDKILNISGETEKYYTDMGNKMVALQKKMMASLSSTSGCSLESIQKNLDELTALLTESTKVSQKENETLKSETPPPGFENFHALLLQIADVRTSAFNNIRTFIETRQYGYLQNAQNDISNGQKLTDLITPTFLEALASATSKSEESQTRENPGTELSE